MASVVLLWGVDDGLLNLLAGRAGGLLVPGTLAGQAGIPRTTLVRYLELLSSVFLIRSIPAWTSGGTRRAVSAPKLAFVDTGIACHLLGQDVARLASPTGESGAMVENLVLMELARQLTWSQQRGTLHHYRSKDKVEVDAVIETPDGRIIGIEVKAGATVRAEDLAGLRHLAQRVGDRFVAGYVSVRRPADLAVRGEAARPATGRAVAPRALIITTQRSEGGDLVG